MLTIQSKNDTSNVTNMALMFTACNNLTSLDVSGFDTSNVTNLCSMFSSCNKLTSLDISNFDTSNVSNISGMFQRCNALTTIYASNLWSTDKVTSSSNMFVNDTNLKGAISYDSSKTDVTYANWTTGYFTYKAATQSIRLNIGSDGTINGYSENAA